MLSGHTVLSGSHWGGGLGGEGGEGLCRGLQLFSAEYLSGQCYQKDRESQWLEQALFGGSQPQSQRERRLGNTASRAKSRGSKSRRGNLGIRGREEALRPCISST